MEICSPCCLIFPPLATFPGTAPLPHRVAQAGLAWPQRACQVSSLSSSPSNLFPYGRSMDPVLQITRAPRSCSDSPPPLAFKRPSLRQFCLLHSGMTLPRPAMYRSPALFSLLPQMSLFVLVFLSRLSERFSQMCYICEVRSIRCGWSSTWAQRSLSKGFSDSFNPGRLFGSDRETGECLTRRNCVFRGNRDLDRTGLGTSAPSLPFRDGLPSL